MMKKIQFYAPGDIRVEEAEIPVHRKQEKSLSKMRLP